MDQFEIEENIRQGETRYTGQTLHQVILESGKAKQVIVYPYYDPSSSKKVFIM